MAILADSTWHYVQLCFWAWVIGVVGFAAYLILKTLYNVSPLHPLAKYPGPLLWRASRLPASYHHATGDLYKCIAAIHEEYGSTVRIAPDELSFTSPEAWTQIYNSRPQLQKSPWHFGTGGDDSNIPPSMIIAPDAEHMRLRRLANPAFLNAGIAEVEPVLQQYADLLCHQLAVSSKEGSQNMVEWYLWTLNDVIGQLALDQEFQCLELRRMHPWPRFLLDVLKQTAAINQFRRFGLSLKLLAPFTPKALIEQRDNFVNTAREAIKKRLDRETDGSIDKSKRPDIIGLMMREMKGGDRLSKEEITSNAVLIVGGGAETTSTCLSATLYHLCTTPHAMRKLKEEIRSSFGTKEEITLKATADLPYLKAVIDESLRIFPVASYITPRVVPKEGHVIDGDFVSGGTHVSMGQWYMGRSDRHFDNAKEFRPERWIDGDVQRVSGRKVDDIMKPFSLGPRNCIGKLLALADIRLLTAKIIWHFDMELDGDHSTWVDDARFYILWQLKPLNVRLTPIRPL